MSNIKIRIIDINDNKNKQRGGNSLIEVVSNLSSALTTAGISDIDTQNIGSLADLSKTIEKINKSHPDFFSDQSTTELNNEISQILNTEDLSGPPTSGVVDLNDFSNYQPPSDTAVKSTRYNNRNLFTEEISGDPIDVDEFSPNGLRIPYFWYNRPTPESIDLSGLQNIEQSFNTPYATFGTYSGLKKGEVTRDDRNAFRQVSNDLINLENYQNLVDDSEDKNKIENVLTGILDKLDSYASTADNMLGIENINYNGKRYDKYTELRRLDREYYRTEEIGNLFNNYRKIFRQEVGKEYTNDRLSQRARNAEEHTNSSLSQGARDATSIIPEGKVGRTREIFNNNPWDNQESKSDSQLEQQPVTTPQPESQTIPAVGSNLSDPINQTSNFITSQLLSPQEQPYYPQGDISLSSKGVSSYGPPQIYNFSDNNMTDSNSWGTNIPNEPPRTVDVVNQEITQSGPESGVDYARQVQKGIDKLNNTTPAFDQENQKLTEENQVMSDSIQKLTEENQEQSETIQQQSDTIQEQEKLIERKDRNRLKNKKLYETTLGEYNEYKTTSENRYNELLKDFSQANTDLENLKENHDRILQEKITAEGELQIARELSNSLQAQLDDANKLSESQYNSLTSQIEAQTTKISGLLNDVKSKTTELENSEKAIKFLEGRLLVLESEKSTLQNEKSDLINRLSESEEDLEALSNNLNDLGEKIKSVSKQRDALRGKFEESKVNNAREIEEIREEYNESFSELQRNLSREQDKNSELSEDITRLESNVRNLSEQNYNLTDTVSELTHDLEASEAEKETMKNNFEIKIVDLENNLETMTEDYNAMNEYFESEEYKKAFEKKWVDQWEQGIRDREDQDNRVQLNSLRMQMQQIQEQQGNKITGLENQLNSYANQLATKTNDLRDLTQNYNKISQDYESVKGTAKDLQNQVQEAMRENNELKDNFDNISKELRDERILHEEDNQQRDEIIGEQEETINNTKEKLNNVLDQLIKERGDTVDIQNMLQLLTIVAGTIGLAIGSNEINKRRELNKKRDLDRRTETKRQADEESKEGFSFLGFIGDMFTGSSSTGLPNPFASAIRMKRVTAKFASLFEQIKGSIENLKMKNNLKIYSDILITLNSIERLETQTGGSVKQTGGDISNEKIELYMRFKQQLKELEQVETSDSDHQNLITHIRNLISIQLSDNEEEYTSKITELINDQLRINVLMNVAVANLNSEFQKTKFWR